jgi:hypothetical protein
VGSRPHRGANSLGVALALPRQISSPFPPRPSRRLCPGCRLRLGMQPGGRPVQMQRGESRRPSQSNEGPRLVGLQLSIRHAGGSSCRIAAVYVVESYIPGAPSSKSWPATLRGTWRRHAAPMRRLVGPKCRHGWGFRAGQKRPRQGERLCHLFRSGMGAQSWGSRPDPCLAVLRASNNLGPSLHHSSQAAARIARSAEPLLHRPKRSPYLSARVGSLGTRLAHE